MQKIKAAAYCSFVVNADAIVFAVGGFVIIKNHWLLYFFKNRVIRCLHFSGKNNDTGDKRHVAFVNYSIGFIFRFVYIRKSVEIAAFSCFCIKGMQNICPEVQLRVTYNPSAVIDDQYFDHSPMGFFFRRIQGFGKYAVIFFQFFYTFQNLLTCLLVDAGLTINCQRDCSLGNTKAFGYIDHFYFHRVPAF